MRVFKNTKRTLGRCRRFVCLAISAFAVIFFSSIIFSSCNNFLDGGQLKEELQSMVNYANAPFYTVRVSVDSGTGVINAGSGDNRMKVTDKLTISFSKDKGYKFIKWQAVQKDNNSVSMQDYVRFEDEKAVDTTVELIREPNSDILIKPLCEETLNVTAKYPIESTEGSERDSTIKLVFSDPLSQQNDLTRIQISISGSNVDGRYNFQDPIIENNQLIIMAKVENRIEVPKGTTRTVKVTIPADFKYISESGEIEIGEEITHTYTINSETCNKANIVFGTTDDNGGSIKVNGMVSSSVSQRFSIGEAFQVSFKVTDGYRFVKWDCTNEGTFLFEYPKSEEYDEKGFNSLTSTAILNLKVINSNDVNLIAVVEKIPTSPIKISSLHGKISPNGEITYKEGDNIPLNFNSDSDYQFIRWVAYNGKEELSDEYIKFGKIDDSETKFTLVKSLGEDVVLNIIPECALRPQVVSASPLYNSDGVYRDRRIIIMFDNEMDEESIYYSALEQQELKEKGYVLLTDSERDGKCYGYWDGENKSSYKFKNITITKRNNANENLLANYKPPYFDKKDKSVLRIDTQKDAGETNPPPGATDILVTVNSQMGSKITGKLVTLPGNYRWAYHTSGNIDTDEPQFVETGDGIFTVQFATAEQTEYKAPISNQKNYQKASEDKDSFGTKNKDLYVKNHLDTKRFWVSGTFSDGGSGPNYLKWEVWKVNSPYYPMNEEIKVDNGQISDLTITGSNAVIQKYLGKNSSGGDLYSKGVAVDIKNNLPEGLYRIDFIIADINEKTNTKSYYFTYDATPPKSVTNVRTYFTNGKLWLNSDIVSVPDLEKIVVESNNVKIMEQDFTGNTKFEQSTPVTLDGSEKEYKVMALDICGNSCSLTVSEKLGVNFGAGCYFMNDKIYFSNYDYPEFADKKIGIVFDADSQSKILIMGEEEYMYNYYNSNYAVHDMYFKYDTSAYTDGLELHNYMIRNYGGGDYIYNQLDAINKNTYKSKIFWYVPCKAEFDKIANNWDDINAQLAKKLNAGTAICYLTSTVNKTGGFGFSATATASAYYKCGNAYTDVQINNSSGRPSFSMGLYFRPIAQYNLMAEN